MKRLFDIVFAAGCLLLFWPLIALAALAIRLTSPGPAFYRARRAGLRGKRFDMFKIRTMHVGADDAGPKITAETDQRITLVGQVLRKLKMDELPQFWNVLRGDMSIVGPRPEDWDIVERYYSPRQRRTLDVRPGIVSPVEVIWFPDMTYHDPPPPGTSIEEHYLQRHMPVQLDEALRYVDNQSLALDLKIIVQTIFTVMIYSWLPPRKRPLPAEALAAAAVVGECR